MTTSVASVFVFFGFLASMLTLPGCGQRLCVAGIGDCAIETIKKTDTQAGTGKFKLLVTNTNLLEKERTEIKAQNAVGEWYVQIVDGASARFEKGNDAVIYIAPDFVVPEGTFSRIKGWDSRYKKPEDTDAMDTTVINLKKAPVK